jgi:hypothetical protein
MPSLHRRRPESVLLKGQGFPCPFARHLSKEKILDQSGRAQHEYHDDKEKKKTKAPAPDKVCIVERYVGHRLILGLEEHDRRSCADIHFEGQSHDAVSPF